MPPCALIGIYLSTSESSVDLSSQCSSELGIDVISATQIKNRAWRLNSTLCCFKETQSPESGCCSQRLRWFLLTPHTCFLLGQQETTFGSFYTLSFISQPHTSRVLLLQPAGEKPWGHFLLLKCLWKRASTPHIPACMTQIITLRPAPHSQMTHEMKSPCCSAPSLCSQPDFMNNTKTNIFVLQLQRQDKQGAKLGANCNTTDFGSQPSFQLLIYFCPNFPPRSPSFQYFWADHNTHRRATNACVAQCLPLMN